MPASAGKEVGRLRTCFASIWVGPDLFPLAYVDTFCYGAMRFQHVRRVVPAWNDKRK